jgi:tetratricopeptide (TPR) repeat protein
MRNETELVTEPTTPEELLAAHKILRADPQRYLRIVNEWISKNPANSEAYFSRHLAWMRVGEPRRALDDLNKVIGFEGEHEPMFFWSRGLVHRHLGQYEKALEDFDRGEAIDPKRWEEDVVFGLLYQADVHARVGDEAAALAYCARLPDNFWTPGVYGAPSGGKADIADKLRRIAAEARRKRDSDASRSRMK